MKKRSWISLSLMILVFSGCANISKQTFVQKAGALPGYSHIDTRFLQPKGYGADVKLQQHYRRLLQNPTIAGAIYDDAVLEGRARSVDSALSINWYRKFFATGLSRLDDNDKLTLIRLLSSKSALATPSECSQIKKDIINAFSLLHSEEMELFWDVSYRAILAGTQKIEVNAEDVRKEAFVAFLAIVAKGKETMSDKELGDTMYPITKKRITCETITKLLELMVLLEPQYRTSFFKLSGLNERRD